MKMKSLKIVVALLVCWAAKPQTLAAQIWKPLGQGFEQVPVAVTSTPDYMYFAFVDSTSFGGNAKGFLVARWNGFFWQNISTFIAGQGSQLTTMAWYKNKLYVGGFFDTVLLASSRTGLLVLEDKKWKNIAKRHIDDFSPLRINDLEVFDNQLYAAGAFSRIDTTRANGLAVYNGSTWDVVNNFQGKYVGIASSLETYHDTLFVGGNYTLGSIPSPIVKIKGTMVLPDTLSPFVSIRHLQAGKNEMMVFGDATGAIKTIHAYKSGGWYNREKNFPNLQTAVFADATFYNDEFWACGIIDIGGKTNNIIKWADTAWVVLDDINLNGVRFIKAFRNKLFVTGNFIYYQRILLNHVAEYDENLAIITGKVYIDANNNCKQDAGEKPVAGQVVRLWNGILVAYTDREGRYSFVVPKSGTYQINTLLRKYWTLSNCVPNQYLFSPSNSTAIFDSADFPMHPDVNIRDVSVKIVPNTGFKIRRGYTEVYNLIYRNNGGQTIPTGTIKLKIDDSLDNFMSIPPPSSINNGIAEWNYTNLAAGEIKGILFRGKVNNNTSNIAFMAEAQSTNDAFADDNYDTLQQTVSSDSSLRGKYIFPEPATGDSITIFPEKGQHEVEYLIRFENKTADTVNTVVVVDTIDLNLSLEYIQELGASHPYTTQVVNLAPQFGKGILIWTFNNINLPPNPTNSNDFTDNRGQIRFKIRLSPTTPIGTLVVNKAHILYDYDVPNATNPVFCMLDKTNSVAENQTIEGLSLYPNPVTNQLNIELPQEALYTLSVNTIEGKQCLPVQYFMGNTTTVDVAGLSKGIYILHLSNGQQSTYTKFVKE